MVNTTQNNSNQSMFYLPFEFWLSVFGSTVYVDAINLFLVPLIGAIGLVLNLIGLRILFYQNFKSIKLFAYLKVYLINSAFICLISIGNMQDSKRFVDFNSYFSINYIIYVYVLLGNTSYFYGCVLDIIIILEQIFIIKNKANFLKNSSPYKYCLLALVSCIVVNFPYYFAYRPSSLTVSLNATWTYTFYFTDYSDFAKSQLGVIALYVVYSLRDFLTLSLQILCNIILIIFFKRHLAKKSKLVKRLETSMESKKGNFSTSTFNIGNKMNTRNLSNKTDSKATLMVITISIFSILEHSSLLLVLIYFQADFQTGFILRFLPNIFVPLKHASNFFILFIFNKSFKAGIRSFFNINF
jgi:hypothetical protein